jgi:MFS family permease
MGWLADRTGVKRVFLIAIGLRSFVSLLLGFAVAPWELYAARSAHGLSMSLRDPSANALIAEHGGRKSIASAFAWYQTAKSVAGSISKAAAGVLLTWTAGNFSLVFGAAFALSLFPLVFVSRYVEDAAPVPRVEPGDAATAPGERRVRIAPLIGLGFLISSTAEMLGGLFPILAKEYAGLTEAQTGLIYTASTLVALSAGPIFGWLADHVSQRLVLMLRSVANALSALMYIFAPSFAGVAMARTLDDAGKAAFRPAWGALMADVTSVDKRTRARTISLLTIGDDAGEIVAPIAAGVLWNVYGLTTVLAVRVVLAIGTEAYAWAIERSRSAQPAVKRPERFPIRLHADGGEAVR